jgi:hypothetical protein
MKIDYTNYEDFILKHFKKLPNEIEIKSGEKNITENSFKDVFGSNEAKLAKSCIYIWKTKKKICRLKGESDIVYIGQTKRSLCARHHSSSKLKATSRANKQKYNDIVEKYDSISVYYYCPDKFGIYNSLDLRKIEGQFLWWYFQNHSEYPPVNYTKTKIRNDEIIV